ncbi:Uma2 family endonuclease [Pseudonocardia broussonetiae]|uniref:Uma2 family endonuclease n=1 Tax=Pseudonocardia broussonetiae TaxID=2736640 RepID=A0A6M6JN96_9PSEU|nr:Uma2 family endonuclease [Pseudonocardia broussonetiae]QJY49428.1 Uma2 family endonuclease [Pseudonocardia broussonetiae]
MVDVEGGAPLAHEGPWSEEAYQALPRDRRIELVDGSLLVAPSTGERHAAAVAAVRAAVEAALPEGLEVSGPVALRLCPGRILVPDLVVSARGAAPSSESGVRDGSVALVVIDVVGSGNGVADRWFKPQLYAGSGIPYALLVDHDDPFAVATMLIGGRYHEYARAGEGEVLRLEEPFGLELELGVLVGGAESAESAESADEPGEFSDPHAESAESPGESADPRAEFADQPGEFADPPGEFADQPGEFADQPGEFANGARGSADGVHESADGAGSFVADGDRESADRPDGFAGRADGSGDGHGPDHGDEQRLGA